jgi:hypothetical protein
MSAMFVCLFAPEPIDRIGELCRHVEAESPASHQYFMRDCGGRPPASLTTWM